MSQTTYQLCRLLPSWVALVLQGEVPRANLALMCSSSQPVLRELQAMRVQRKESSEVLMEIRASDRLAPPKPAPPAQLSAPPPLPPTRSSAFPACLLPVGEMEASGGSD